jgi:hypothetical protein
MSVDLLTGLVQGPMRSNGVIIGRIVFQNPAQMFLVQDNDMVHTLARRKALDRKVTGDELARSELTHDRLLGRTPSSGERTARAKTAAGRWRIR